MEKEFIPYEQALELKELGFDEPCFKIYNIKDEKLETWEIKNSWLNGDLSITAPLYQQVFRWFREKHKLQAEILWRGDMNCFCYKTGKFKQGSHDFSKDDYNTYEEAELECLKKLIEIVKEKS